MSRPDLRLELVEARAALRATNREIKRFTAESDFWLEDNQVYKKALEQQEKALARVEELTARLEIAADTAQERHDRVLDHYADALWFGGVGGLLMPSPGEPSASWEGVPSHL